MKNMIEKIYVASEIHWDYDYDELKKDLAEKLFFDSDEDLIKMTDEIYNDPDNLADHLDIPTIIIIPDDLLEPYLKSNNTVDYALVEYLSDTYGFCVKEFTYNTYTMWKFGTNFGTNLARFYHYLGHFCTKFYQKSKKGEQWNCSI